MPSREFLGRLRDRVERLESDLKTFSEEMDAAAGELDRAEQEAEKERADASATAVEEAREEWAASGAGDVFLLAQLMFERGASFADVFITVESSDGRGAVQSAYHRQVVAARSPARTEISKVSDI